MNIIHKALILVGVIFLGIFLHSFARESTDTVPTERHEALTIKNPSSYTQVDLNSYYMVYSDPHITHVRKVLDSYLGGNVVGTSAPDVVVKTGEVEEGFLSGLDSFKKEYYESNFVALSIDDLLGGGADKMLEFQDKQDRVFVAWV